MNEPTETTTQRLREIDERIGVLRQQYDDVEGTPTEVYSRIVGYYRSLKNWNRGKRQEYGDRVAFRPTGHATPIAPTSPDADGASVTDRVDALRSSHSHPQFHYFYRTACPNCPPMRAEIDRAGINASLYDVDTEEGMSEAIRFQVLSTPTIVVTDDSGTAIAKFRSVHELHAEFGTGILAAT